MSGDCKTGTLQFPLKGQDKCATASSPVIIQATELNISCSQGDPRMSKFDYMSSGGACSNTDSRPLQGLKIGITDVLPTEIIDYIFTYANSNSLCCLSLVNRGFQISSKRVLYRNIGRLSPTRTVRCLQTLATSPSLASCTRFYEVGNLEDDTHLLPSFFALLSRALFRMDNLTELTILLCGPYAYVLRNCHFHLKKLTSAIDWNNDFAKWIEGQDDIRDAMFCGRFVTGTRLSYSALPKLSRISASPLVLAAVVPDRPIKDVEMCLEHPSYFNEGLMSATMKIVKFSTGPLQSLQIISHISESAEEFLSTMGVIPRIHPQLDSLALHAITGAITKDILNGLFNIISEFTSLKSVMILSKNNSDALHSENCTAGLAAKWHGGCCTLECVSFPNETWVRNQKYGWLTLNDLERILAEREKELLEREAAIQEREKELAERNSALEAKEHRLEAQILRLRGRKIGSTFAT